MSPVKEKMIMLREQIITSLVVLMLENKKWFIDNRFTVDDLREYLLESPPIKQYKEKMLSLLPPGTNVNEIKPSPLEFIDYCIYSRLDILTERVILADSETYDYAERVLDIREWGRGDGELGVAR